MWSKENQLAFIYTSTPDNSTTPSMQVRKTSLFWPHGVVFLFLFFNTKKSSYMLMYEGSSSDQSLGTKPFLQPIGLQKFCPENSRESRYCVGDRGVFLAHCYKSNSGTHLWNSKSLFHLPLPSWNFSKAMCYFYHQIDDIILWWK